MLLAELEATLARPKLQAHLDAAEINGFLELLRGLAERVVDRTGSPPSPEEIEGRLSDRAAGGGGATLVTGDADLLELEGSIPALSPAAFLDSLS